MLLRNECPGAHAVICGAPSAALIKLRINAKTVRLSWIISQASILSWLFLILLKDLDSCNHYYDDYFMNSETILLVEGESRWSKTWQIWSCWHWDEQEAVLTDMLNSCCVGECQDRVIIGLIPASQTGPGVADGQLRLEHLKHLICFSAEKPGDPGSGSLSFREVRLWAVSAALSASVDC